MNQSNIASPTKLHAQLILMLFFLLKMYKNSHYTENQIIAGFENKQYIVNEGNGSIDVCVYVTFIGNVELSEPLNILIETLTPRENTDSAQSK